MTTSLRMLGLTLLLALAHIFLTAAAKRQQDGVGWALGARDTPPPEYTGVAGRLDRAQRNLFETLPLFAAAVLAAHAAGRDDALAAIGAQLYFWSRLAYVPLYAAGVKVIRTVAFAVSVAGLGVVLATLLR